MKVCIIGGGNIGTAMAAIIAERGHEVIIKTGKPERWSKNIIYTDSETGDCFSADLNLITDKAEDAASADVIFITVPSFSLKNVIEEIKPYIKPETAIGIIPGTGGVEFILHPLIKEGFTIFGFDRVPCISRVTEYGKKVSASKKKSVRLAAFNCPDKKVLCNKMFDLLGVECLELENYLTVTFTPSNPILHTTRLYAMYQGAAPSYSWPENIPFYESWDNLSSEMLIKCDNELQGLCKKIDGLDLTGVIPLTIHYESPTVEAMTNKISHIPAFKGISSPMLQQDGKYVLDLNSRYFTEDFPYGLCIIKGFAEIFDYAVPNIDKVLKWYQDISGKVYETETGFDGPDLKNTAVPQLYGIKTPEDVYSLYK